MECPPLAQTISNGKVTSCGKYYQETCTFACDKNHHVLNEASSRKKLVCLVNGRWSQRPPLCVGKKIIVHIWYTVWSKKV